MGCGRDKSAPTGFQDISLNRIKSSRKVGIGHIMNYTLLLQEVVVGITTGFIYALIALGYTMVYGIIELINFAHGDVFMIGTLICITIFGVFGITNSPNTAPSGLALGG